MKIRFSVIPGILLTLLLMGPETQAQSTERKSAVSVTESDKTYEFSATFNPDLNEKVKGYMNDRLGKDSHFSFKNTQTDAQLTLDNHLSFYMKSDPGKLVLKFDKRKNSADLYTRFKSMCEGIRDIIQKK